MGWMCRLPTAVSSVETLGYEVVRKLGEVEIRKYPGFVAARVNGYGDGGFNLLFRFISGKNNRSSKVAMTAPVVSEKVSMTAPVLSDEGSIASVMPRGHTMENTPQPTDNRVKLVEFAPRRLAVLRFSGKWGGKAFETKSRKMLEQLRDAGIATIREAFSMRYNAPFTPWFMRRNEVAIEVTFE